MKMRSKLSKNRFSIALWCGVGQYDFVLFGTVTFVCVCVREL